MNIVEIQAILQNLTNKKITQADLGRALGVDRSAVNVRMRLKSEVKLSDIEKIANYYNVSKTNFIENVETTSTNFNSIPVLGEVYASMGSGITIYNEEQTGTYSISNQLANDIGININASRMIFASGDSMAPTIIGGDSLLVDTSKTDVYDGRIYCVRIDGQLYAKRLQKIPPDKIKVVSDNQEKYDAFYVEKNNNFDFEVIGEIRWWGRVAR